MSYRDDANDRDTHERGSADTIARLRSNRQDPSSILEDERKLRNALDLLEIIRKFHAWALRNDIPRDTPRGWIVARSERRYSGWHSSVRMNPSSIEVTRSGRIRLANDFLWILGPRLSGISVRGAVEIPTILDQITVQSIESEIDRHAAKGGYTWP
jgi:hypothetical protein